MKFCTKCGVDKPQAEFNKNKRMKDGLQCQCKACHKDSKTAWQQKNKHKAATYVASWSKRHPDKSFEKRTKRRACEKQAIPLWFETDRVSELYNKAEQFGFQVDHIVPIKGKTVCGLHCWANLQLLSPEINASKGNRHWPDMPE